VGRAPSRDSRLRRPRHEGGRLRVGLAPHARDDAPRLPGHGGGAPLDRGGARHVRGARGPRRIGWVEAPEVWGGLVEGLPKGLSRRGGGLDGTQFWGRTYWGGALFWFLAELGIRDETGNRKGLPDALRGLHKAGGSIRVHWPIDRALAAADEATGTRVLRDLYAKMGPSAMDVDLDAIWKRLGIQMDRGTVTFDDSAPLARIRRTITEPPG
jgi:hypothetical protein